MASTVGKVISCRAAVVRDLKSPISVENVKVLPPTPGHVRIKMVATALCHSDLSVLSGTFPLQKLPYIPGHEGAGIVESVGEGVKTVKPGDKVLTLFMPRCGECPPCISKKSNYCFDIKRVVKPISPFLRCEGLDGLTSFTDANGKTIYHCFGASSFSEYTVIPENSCVKINPETKLEVACIMACGFLTGYGTSSNAVDIKAGDVAAVWGLGAVGLACVVGCKDMGASKIIGIDIDEKKEDYARKFGCTDYIALSKLDTDIKTKIFEIAPLGLDFAFACAGSIQAMEDGINCLGLGGTAVIVGLSKAKETVKFVSNDFLTTKKIKGTLYGDYNMFEDVPKLVDKFVAGKLPVEQFITDYFTLDQINQAFDQMKQLIGVRSVIKF